MIVLHYTYVEGILERRAPHRDAHLAHAAAWVGDGRLVAGGAVGDPPHGGLLLFRVSADEVAQFVADDPYVAADLVTAWRTEPWTVTIGAV